MEAKARHSGELLRSCIVAGPVRKPAADSNRSSLEEGRQIETAGTMSSIYSACMQSSNASDLKRYIVDAKLNAKLHLPDLNINKLQAEAAAEADAHEPRFFITLARDQARLVQQPERGPFNGIHGQGFDFVIHQAR